jgi:hypothetical protein
MIYCFDTSAFINGWHRYYHPENFPVWSDIEELSLQGRVIATEEVLVELEKQEDDEVFAWAIARPHIFRPIDEQIQIVTRDILREHPRLVDNRKLRSRADPFVIALAQIEGAAVVTYEDYSHNATKPKIPNVCQALHIPWMTLLHLIKQEGWRYRRE